MGTKKIFTKVQIFWSRKTIKVFLGNKMRLLVVAG